MILPLSPENNGNNVSKLGLVSNVSMELFNIPPAETPKTEHTRNTGVGYVNIILISLISGLILVSIMIFVVYYISITSYNRDIDPDNIVIPISTSMTDAISSLILVSVSFLILGALI